MASINCNEELRGLDFIELGCDEQLGSIVAVAFIDETVLFGDDETYASIKPEIEDPANWIGLAYSSDIIVFPEVRGSYSGGAPTEVNSKGDQDTRVIGAKHDASFMLDSVKFNADFVNALNKSRNYKFAYVTGIDYRSGGGVLHYVPRTVSIYGRENVPEGTDSLLDWMFNVKWSDINNPLTFDLPAGIFE